MIYRLLLGFFTLFLIILYHILIIII